MNNTKNKSKLLTDIDKIRLELLNIRFAKAKRKNFTGHKYKQTRKHLARLLTSKNK